MAEDTTPAPVTPAAADAPKPEAPKAPAPEEIPEAHKAAVAEMQAAQKAHEESNGHHNAKVLCRIALAALKNLNKPVAAIVAATKKFEAWCAENAPEPKK